MKFQTKKFLRNDSGSYDAIGNYTTAEDFYYQPSGPVTVVRLIGTLSDVGTLDSGAYGNNISLTGSNGIRFLITDVNGNELEDLADGLIVQTNGDYHHLGYDFINSNFGAGNAYGAFRWTFTRDNLKGICLDEQKRFVVRLLGDFSGLVSHRFKIGLTVI